MVTKTREDAMHLEELMQIAEAAAEPGGPDEDLDIGEGVRGKLTVASAGYTYIWDTRTGERSKTNNNMLRVQLQKKRPDGSRVFTTVNPGIRPMRGSSLCPLHADHPDAGIARALNLRTCRKSNLLNPGEALSHMERKHKNEWKRIKEERERLKEEDEAKLRRLNIEALLRAQQNQDAMPAPAAAPVHAAPTGVAALISQNCPDCGETVTSKPKGQHFAMSQHRKKCAGRKA